MFFKDSNEFKLSEKTMKMIEEMKAEVFKETGIDIPVQILVETCVEMTYKTAFTNDKEEQLAPEEIMAFPMILH